MDEDFSGTSVTFTHDNNGNLTADGTYAYTYDAWNRLVKVTASNDTDVTIQTAEYDGKGRRMKKAVTNSGDPDATVVYLYDGVAAGVSAGRICETQDGSDVMVQQFIHGTQYIDELVMVRVKDKGDLYVHQDANWNVVAVTDLGTHLVERYVYTPYGELIVEQETSFGDYDGDADVDSDDRAVITGACNGVAPTGACRIVDVNMDGTVDLSDLTPFDALSQGIARHPGRASTGVDQPFAHQGLLYDAEIGSYQNRHRQYDPAKRRFLQRDPLGIQRDFFRAQAYYRDGLNLYGYVGSNPRTFFDPSGLGYCGPGPSGGFGDWIVPDSPFGCDFSECCLAHDDCYGDCTDDAPPQKQCDSDFLDCMQGVGGFFCDLLAWIYWAAVSIGGGGAYHNNCPSS